MMGVVGLLAFLLSACSPVPSDPRAVLEEKAATVDTAVQDLLDTLETAGFDDVSARGSVDQCQSQPAPGVSYSAGIAVNVGDDPAGGFDALVTELDEAGWKTTDAYRDVKIDPDKPMGRFSRDDITLDVKTGGFSSGGESHQADLMVLSVTVEDPCVRIADGTSFLDFQDLDKDILPRS